MQDFMTFLFHHLSLTYTFVLLLALILVMEMIRLKRRHFCINSLKAIQLINHDNAVVIDIRPKELFQKGHIIDAQLLSPQDMQQHPKLLEKFKNKPLILVCSAGQDSQKIAALFVKQGYNIYSLAGGMRAWTAAELPVIKE